MAEAGRLIEAGLAEQQLRRKDLCMLPKSDARKAAVARRVRERTTVSLSWLGQQLQMGTPMNVSRLTCKP